MARKVWSKILLSGMVGWGAGWVLDFSGRQLVFPIVLAVALFVLMGMARAQRAATDSSQAASDPVQALLKRGETLNEAQARQWLDDLLLRQQR